MRPLCAAGTSLAASVERVVGKTSFHISPKGLGAHSCRSSQVRSGVLTTWTAAAVGTTRRGGTQGAAANLGGSQPRLGGGTRCGPRMAHQGIPAAGAQADGDDDGQDLPQCGDRCDEGRMQLSVPWSRLDACFKNQIQTTSNNVNEHSL